MQKIIKKLAKYNDNCLENTNKLIIEIFYDNSGTFKNYKNKTIKVFRSKNEAKKAINELLKEQKTIK